MLFCSNDELLVAFYVMEEKGNRKPVRNIGPWILPIQPARKKTSTTFEVVPDVFEIFKLYS